MTEHKAINTGGKDQQMLDAQFFFHLKISATTCQRSQATVPDASRVSAASSLLQCLHVTIPRRTAKIKQVTASSTTRKETQKHDITREKVSASCHTPAPSTWGIQGKRQKYLPSLLPTVVFHRVQSFTAIQSDLPNASRSRQV